MDGVSGRINLKEKVSEASVDSKSETLLEKNFERSMKAIEAKEQSKKDVSKALHRCLGCGKKMTWPEMIRHHSKKSGSGCTVASGSEKVGAIIPDERQAFQDKLHKNALEINKQIGQETAGVKTSNKGGSLSRPTVAFLKGASEAIFGVALRNAGDQTLMDYVAASDDPLRIKSVNKEIRRRGGV